VARPDVDLSFLLNQASYALAARMAEALRDLELSVGEYCVLWKAGEGERTQVEIAELAALDKSVVVKAVDGLERLGLAARRVHDTDRRARLVVLTEAGTALLERAHEAVSEVYDEALSDLAPRARATFLAQLQQVAGGVLATPSHVTAMRRRRTPRPAPR
jgi:MarR family transcriptional regulator, transcriptional regulator for hemolysin